MTEKDEIRRLQRRHRFYGVLTLVLLLISQGIVALYWELLRNGLVRTLMIVAVWGAAECARRRGASFVVSRLAELRQQIISFRQVLAIWREADTIFGGRDAEKNLPE